MRPTTALPLVTTREPKFFCMQPARRPLDAGFRSYCSDVGSLPPQNAVDGHRHSILQSYGLTAYLISAPQLGGMPWNPFSSTRSISISYQQEAVSEHRRPRNRSVVGKLVRDRFG